MNNVESYLYMFTDKDEKVVYVGITNDIDRRISQHFSDNGHLGKSQYREVRNIYYSIHISRNEVSLYERYYVAKLAPEFNQSMKKGGDISIELPTPEFRVYEKTEMYVNKVKEITFMQRVLKEFKGVLSNVPQKRIEAISSLFGTTNEQVIQQFEAIVNQGGGNEWKKQTEGWFVTLQ